MGTQKRGVRPMSGFFFGLVVGSFAGVIGTLLLLLIVYSIPDGDYLRSQVSEPWRGVGPLRGKIRAWIGAAK